MRTSSKEHWDKVYSSREATELGWYEEVPEQSLKLFEKCDLDEGDSILDVGAGVSSFFDSLLDMGYSNLTALDISEISIKKLKERLGPEKSSKVKWIVDDVSKTSRLKELGNVSLWHDRAVLHFLTEKSRQDMYFSTLKKSVKNNGFVIIAVFSLEGAKKCSGLDLKNYDQNMLAESLGDDFELIEYFNYTHTMPNGDPRPYIYTLFKRIN